MSSRTSVVVAVPSSSKVTSGMSTGKRPPTTKNIQRLDDMGEEMHERKRPRTKRPQEEDRNARRTKTKPAFNPRPLGASPDAATGKTAPAPRGPPPPSTRKIGRFRESLSAHRTLMETPAPTRTGNVLADAPHGDDEEDGDDPRRRRGGGKAKGVPLLEFRKPTRPRASAAPPQTPSAARRGPRMSRFGDEAFVDGVVPIPISDTPVIKRNREMRERAVSMRGQRASTSFDRGEPSYPHPTIPANSFFRHLPVDHPEPMKARWLITWCAKRAVEMDVETSAKRKKKRDPHMSPEIDRLLAEVFDDFASTVAKGGVDTNVFGSGEGPTSVLSSIITTNPNPRNVQNRETLEKEEALIKRLKTEDRDWIRLAKATNQYSSVTEEATRSVHPAPDMADASDFFQRLTHLSEDAMAVAERDIGVADDFGDVEYEVDLLHQTLHQGNRYLDSTKRYLDSVFSSLVDELRGAPAIPPPDDPTKPDTTSLLAAASAGPSRPRTTPLQLVRAFATADSQHQDPEVVARAAAIPAIATRTVPITPRRPATAVPTPRRASVYGQRLGTPGHR